MGGFHHSKAGSIVKRVFNPFYNEKKWMLANLCILDFDLFRVQAITTPDPILINSLPAV